MKWTLIFIIKATGIYESGLTFRTFEDCHMAAEEIRRTEVGFYSDFHEAVRDSQYSEMIKSLPMECVPTK